MCGPSLVDEVHRERIAAYAASFHQVTQSPFGPDDEIGMLNLLSADTARDLLRAADGGRVFDLGVDLFVGMPTWTAGGEPPFHITMVHTPRGTVVDDPVGVGRAQNELVGWSADAVSMFTHCGTHLDTLNHYGYGTKIWNGFDADEHLGSLHWTVAGADRQPPIIARGVLIDVARAHGLDVLPESYGIGAEDLRAALDAQGMALWPGDVVMLRTGRGSLWPDAEAYLAREPGLDREGAEFLARSGAVVVGADNIALEQLPSADPDNWMPVHTYLFAEAGVPIVEVVNLEELAAEECYEFAFVAACLKIRGATAGPMRPLALPLVS
ncbi:MAG: cyclase family protein [Nitriliruptorales bacterium]|nr:cyclase family protein [Nitriliruptorales bacterium]